MPLQYRPVFDLNVADILTLDFSRLGTKLAAVTQSGTIVVWDVQQKSMYHPSSDIGPNFGTTKPFILWVSDTTFICTYSDGYTLTGRFIRNPETNKEELTLRRQRLANYPICMVSFDQNTYLLAVGDEDGVRLWREGDNHWIYSRDLPEPHSAMDLEDSRLGVTVVAWIKSGVLLVAYIKSGFAIWNTSSCTIERSFQPTQGRQICGGTMCHDADKFIALNDLNTIDVYDIFSGEPWSPPQLSNIFFVRSIHRGSGFIVGRHNQADLVSISETRVSQVLHQGSSLLDCVAAIAIYQDATEDEFLIATASGQKVVIWNAAELTRRDTAHVAGINSSHQTKWFSFLFGKHGSEL